VTFPDVASLKFTCLITPTATVCRMSRTAKRPRGGNSWKDSTHIGLDGTRTIMAASPDLNWLIIRNNNAYLLKKRNIKKPFSTESNNLTNTSSFRYNGLVHKKTVGIVPATEKKGFTVVLKTKKNQAKPAKNTYKITYDQGARRSLSKLRNTLASSHYRNDLKQAAVRRASAVLRSQKAPKPKKPTAKKE